MADELQDAVRRLQQEKGEVSGMLQIITDKLHVVEEDNFDLHSSMATFEAETQYNSDKKQRELQNRITALESELAFRSERLQNAERAKLRVFKEVEELQQKQRVESKRRDAERRLMATKRRKQESFLAASQSMIMSQKQVTRPPPVPVVEIAVQTETKLSEKSGEGSDNELKEENARLVSYLLTGSSRDLLTLLNGTISVAMEDSKPNSDDDRTQPPQGWHCATLSQFLQASSGNSLNDSMQHSPGGVQFSQSVFSQLAGRASVEAHASLLSVAMETNATQTTLATDRARELYDVMGRMLAGEVSAVALAPVLIKYLAAPTDLNVSVLCSVLRVMYSVMHHSAHFQRFLLVASSRSDEASSSTTGFERRANSMVHPRIALPGLRFTSLGDYLSAQTDYESVVQSELLQLSAAEAASEQRQLRAKLLSALCRVIKNNLKESAVVKDGLGVLCFWVDLGLSHRPPLKSDFKPLLAANVIPAILLAPKGLPAVKAQALGLLSHLLRIPEVFTEIETEAKKSLLFNRCAKMLANNETLSPNEAFDMRTLQHQFVKLLLSIVTSFPSTGIRFVLESTQGSPGGSDGHRSIIYYLAQLLHQETSDARTMGASCGTPQRLNVDLIQDSLALLGLLSRYVDLHRDLGGDDHEQTFLAVLYFLSNLTQENDSIAATARSLATTMNLPG